MGHAVDLDNEADGAVDEVDATDPLVATEVDLAAEWCSPPRRRMALKRRSRPVSSAR
jgi:hypothetical protein